MKPKQLLILLIVALVVLAAILFTKKGAEEPIDDQVGKELFPKFPAEAVSSISLNAGKETVNLELVEGKWVCKDRENFPANFDNINSLVRKLYTLKIAGVQNEVADKYLGQYKLMAPGTGGKDDETGTHVVMRKADGTELANFIVGKNPASNASMSFTSGSQTQYVKLANSGTKVHKVKDGFDYYLTNVTKDWLYKTDFYSAQKIKSVEVTDAEKPENSWKIFREKENIAQPNDTADLKLADPKPGEEFDTAKGGNSGNAFSSASFNDVVVGEEKNQTGLDNPKRTAVIETFEGFKYVIKIGNLKPPKDPNQGASDEYYISVEASATLNETPPPPPEDPPADPNAPPKTEEQKKADEEAKKQARESAEKTFQENLKKQKEKLEKEKALNGRIFLVSKWTIEPLLKNRSEFMKDKPAESTPSTSPPAEGAAAAAPPAPANPEANPSKKEPITATTPPIEVTIPPKDAKDAKNAKDAKDGKKPTPKKPQR